MTDKQILAIAEKIATDQKQWRKQEAAALIGILAVKHGMPQDQLAAFEEVLKRPKVAILNPSQMLKIWQKAGIIPTAAEEVEALASRYLED